MENKNNVKLFKASIVSTDGKEVSLIGVGKPQSTFEELLIISPDGKEVVFPKNNIRYFVLEPYVDKAEEK